MQRYSFSPMTRAGVMILIAFFSIMAIGLALFVWLSSEPINARIGLIPHIFVLMILVVWLIWYYIHMYDSVVVTEAGLTYELASGQPIVISWNQIDTLVSHSLRRRYDVRDDHGRCLMRICFDLDNFAQLDARLREHLRTMTPDGRTTFNIHSAGSKPIVTTCSVLLVLSLFIFSIKGADLRTIVWSFLSGLGIGWGLYGRVERIVITKEGVVVEYWRRKTFIPFSTVQGVTLQNDYVPGAWRNLSIQRTGQRAFSVKCTSEEAPILQGAIETAWKQKISSQGVA